jgi:hypothetical protein
LYITDFGSGQILRLAQAPLVSVTLSSQPARDGFIVETSETSSKGGFINSAAPVIRLGDQDQNRQVLGIVSFNRWSADNVNHIISSPSEAGITGGHVSSMLQADIEMAFWHVCGSGSVVQAIACRSTLQSHCAAVNNIYSSLYSGIPVSTGRKLTPWLCVVQDNNNLSADLLNIWPRMPLRPIDRTALRYYLP